jgi:polynucleotide 5'-hydroxyl-kinase GRC3/NOL9
LNRYLTGQGKSARPAPAVCYLDLDPAKPGYTPPGQMSLTVVKSLNLGPAFTHPASSPSMPRSEGNTTIRSHAIPSNLANYGDYYRACAEDLFLTYKTLRSRDPTLPLIINTPGSLHSTHMDILADLLARFKPHHAVHLGDTQAIDTEQATKLHAVQTIVSQSRGTIHEITAQSPIVTPMRTDAQLRAMHMQSYFHAKTAATWNTRPLTTLVPWEFCFEDTPERAQDFVSFAMYAEPIEPSSLIHALNGSIVQIVESTSSAIQASLARTKRYRIPYFEKSEQTGMLESLDPKTSKVVCTALVRGFDPERRVVQVLVPKSHEGLLYTLAPERTVFVGGCCDAPEWAYVEEGTGVDVPWVEDEGVVDAMGYLNTVRRVRKFQT